MTSLTIHSGGLDSTVALWLSRNNGPVMAVSFIYGQRHRERELTAASAICAAYGIDHRTVTLGSLGGSALTDLDAAIPVGHYADASMSATVVPGRNLLFIANALPIAHSIGASSIVIGVHSGDHPIYADCRPVFIDAARAAVEASTDGAITLDAPLLHLDKAGIVRLGAELGAPMSDTWSCYVGGAVHCGRCGTCYERREAFTLAGVTDPTIYEEA